MIVVGKFMEELTTDESKYLAVVMVVGTHFKQ